MTDFVRYPTVDANNIVGNLATMKTVVLPIQLEFAADEIQTVYLYSSPNIVEVKPISE